MKKLPLSPLFERIVIGSILLVQVLLVLNGYSTYQKLSNIIRYVKFPENGSEEIAHTRELISDVSRAEHYAKSFHLTGSQTYLNKYYEAAVSLGHKVDNLEEVQWDDKRQKMYANQIIHLTEEAMLTYNDIIGMENDAVVINTLSSIAPEFEPVDTSAKAKETFSKEEQKEGFLKRVFGKKKTDELRLTDQSGGVDSLALMRKDVKKKVRAAAAIQKEELQKLNAEELRMTKKLLLISDKIYSLVGKMEEIEKKRIKDRNDKAEIIANESRRALLSFGALIVVLLFVTVFFTLRYMLFNRKMKNVLSTEKEQAQKLAEMRQNLLSHMSHEIRTPLNSVIGFIEQVLDSELNDEQREQLTISKKSSDHLLSIINNILESSKLKSGKMKFSEINYSPVQLLTEIVKSMSIQAHAKNLQMEYENIGEMPGEINGDPLRLKQVVLNIIGNSIKYTQNGYIKLTARVNGQMLELDIEDSGEGIPEDKLEKIFDQYEQLHSNSTQPGTGLGLYITRGLVESQGGSITIKSTFAKGTVVSLSIPFKKAIAKKDTENIIGITSADLAVLKGKKVLIADDEKYNRMLLAAILKKNGILFAEAANGAEALETFLNDHYDLVLMDVRMPEMDGLQATMKIREMTDKRKSRVPVIALTAGLASEKIERCQQAGMNDFLEKPFREGILLQKMSALIYASHAPFN